MSQPPYGQGAEPYPQRPDQGGYAPQAPKAKTGVIIAVVVLAIAGVTELYLQSPAGSEYER